MAAALSACASPAASPTAVPRPADVARQIPAPVEHARTQLARYLGVATDEVVVVRIAPAEWPSTALGCPVPAAATPEVPTPTAGFSAVLRGPDGREREVHTDLVQAAILCGFPR
jgi:hypothetical protein